MKIYDVLKQKHQTPTKNNSTKTLTNNNIETIRNNNNNNEEEQHTNKNICVEYKRKQHITKNKKITKRKEKTKRTYIKQRYEHRPHDNNDKRTLLKQNANEPKQKQTNKQTNKHTNKQTNIDKR